MSASPPPSPTPRRRAGGRSERVRAAVMQATLAELTEVGYQQLTIPSVAQRCGVHRSSIYRRWGTRERLALEATFDHFREGVAVVDSGSLLEDLVAIHSAAGRLLADPLGVSGVHLAVAAAPGSEVAVLLQAEWAERLTSLSWVFERAVARGEWPAGRSPLPCLQALIGMVLLRVFMLRQPVTAQALRPLIAALLPER